MAKIIFNYKICDRADACGGIEVCPNGAIYFDNNQKKPVWNREKCTFCLKCTLPSACPVGAIVFAADDLQEQNILETINADPHTEEWLWFDRYGVQPGHNSNITNINKDNFKSILENDENKLIDVWHEDFLDCRLHSPLFSDIINNTNFIIYKLDAKKYPKLAKRLDISTYPSLLVYAGTKQISIYKGLFSTSEAQNINQLLIKFK